MAAHVLITGGCGYVGTVLTQAVLARTDCRVTVLDTQWFGNHLTASPRLATWVDDVRNIATFDLSPFDTIFHLANIANDPSVDLNPYSSWEVNVLAGMRLVDQAARQGVKQFIFASSSSVYGVKSEPRVTEDLELFPLGVQQDEDGRGARGDELRRHDDDDHRQAGHCLRILAADAPRCGREPAHDAGSDKRRDYRPRW